MSAVPVYAAAADVYWDLGWRGVIPVDPADKGGVPPGFTGHRGADVTRGDLERFIKTKPGHNLGLRLPPDVIGIDVDAYDGKTGAATLAEGEKRWGKLPEGNRRSTSRNGADPISGIQLYRIPAGVQLVDRIEFPELGIGDIEIIQHHHRHAQCWPSVHNRTGQTYGWYGPDRQPVDPPRYPDDIPELPQRWLAALTKPAAQSGDFTGVPYDIGNALTEGEPSPRVAARRDAAIEACDGPSRHDHTREHVLALLRFGQQGDPGVLAALLALREAYVAATGPDRKGGHPQAEGEFNDLVTGRRVPELLAENGEGNPAWWFANISTPNTGAENGDDAGDGGDQGDTGGADVGGDGGGIGQCSGAQGWLSDANVSELLVRRVLRGKYHWAKGLGWMRFDGKRWTAAADPDVIEASRRFAISLVVEQVRSGADPEKIRTYTRRLSAGAVGAAANLAKGQLLIDGSAFDRHPDLLNTANGVVDLRTGKLGPHDPSLLLTKITPTNYVPGATHPDWTLALAALPDDVTEWARERFGQGVTGHPTPDDVLPVFHGAGSNGKTTLTTGISRALGDHAVTVPDRVLLANPGDHPTELMTLRGARVALLEETPEARHLNVKRLKDVLGTTQMSARYIRRDSVEWSPTHTLFVSTNYRPQVSETDHGTWRRLALVSFPFTYRRDGEDLDGERDRRGDATLRERVKLGLQGQHEAILAWLVEGARRWYAAGQVMSEPPQTVADDTRRWRRESDLILSYFDDTLIADPDYYMPGEELYADFTAWLVAGAHPRWTTQLFVSRFGQHDEVARLKIVYDRIRPSATEQKRSSKPPLRPLGERERVWIGVRYRTDDDVRARTSKSPEQGKQDSVPAVPDDSVNRLVNPSREVYPSRLGQLGQQTSGEAYCWGCGTPDSKLTETADGSYCQECLDERKEAT